MVLSLTSHTWSESGCMACGALQPVHPPKGLTRARESYNVIHGGAVLPYRGVALLTFAVAMAAILESKMY